MRGTYCDIHGHSNTDFRYADWTICWRCQSKLLAQSAAIERVRDLHRVRTAEEEEQVRKNLRLAYPVLTLEPFDAMVAHILGRCQACREPYPCPTIKALDNP